MLLPTEMERLAEQGLLLLRCLWIFPLSESIGLGVCFHWCDAQQGGSLQITMRFFVQRVAEELNTTYPQKTNLDSGLVQDGCKIYLVQQHLHLTPATSSSAKGVSRL